MRVIRFSVTLTAALVVLACFSATTQAGDAAKAKRNLMVAKMNAESGRWGELEAAMKKAEGDMNGLTDAEKAPLLAEIASIKAMVTKRLDRASKADPGMSKPDIQRAEMRLKSDEATL